MNTAEINDEVWEKALAMIENPEDMSDTDFRQASHDESVQAACKELLDCRQAVQEKFGQQRFDANAAWERFCMKPHRRSYRHMLVGGVIGVAATLLLVFGLSFLLKTGNDMPEGVMVYQANDNQQEILLSAEGYDLPLTDTDRLIDVGGVKPRGLGGSVKALDYRSISVPNVSAHRLTTPCGKDIELILSDGTKVWLNADSKLDYPSKFEGKQRVVILQGEAFFEVAKNNGRPFIVKTKNFETRVLGTKFNVRCYSDNDSHVTLIDGEVEVTNTRSGKTVILAPGDDANFMADGSIQTAKVDVDSYVYWKEGFFYFDNVPLVDIMQTIGRWYNVNVIFSNTATMQYRLHFLCDRAGGVEHAITLLNRMEKAKIRFDGKSIMVD